MPDLSDLLTDDDREALEDLREPESDEEEDEDDDT